MGIMSLGVVQMFTNALYAWNSGTAKMKLNGEARLAMMTMRKLIHSCQGSTIIMSRYNSQQPVNSYFAAVAGETIFATSTQQSCGCGTSSDNMTVGSKGEYVHVYQNGKYLIARAPKITGNVDWTSQEDIQAHVSYQYVTLSANLDNISFTMSDSTKGNLVYISARFSKKYLPQKPPATLMLKEAVVIKHPHSSGFYVN